MGFARTQPVDERFWSKVAVRSPTQCWEWLASKRLGGYGQFSMGFREPSLQAHRFAYELVVGPIPDGLVIDHLCRNRACCNPAHMDPVQPRVNTLRGVGVTANNARKTRCVNGHEFTPENTRIRPNGWRECRECGLVKSRRHRARKVARA